MTPRRPVPAGRPILSRTGTRRGRTARIPRPFLACWGIAGVVAASACATQRAAPAEDPAGPRTVAFVGVSVVPMTAGAGVLRDQTVLVREGLIAAVGHAARVRVPAGAFRIDGSGRYLMPGLADMHVHLEHFERPDLLALFLASGVTAVRNMDGRPQVLAWKRAVQAGELPGPAIHTAGPVLDGDPPISDDNTVVRTAREARAAVRAQVDAGYDFIKVYTGLSPEAYRAVLAAAAEAGVQVAGHVPRRVSAEEALAGGQRAIEHLADYGDMVEAEDSPVRGRWHWSRLYLAMPVDSAGVERAAARIAASGVWTVPTLVQADRALAPPDSIRSWLSAPEVAYLPPEAPEFWEELARGRAERLDAEDWAVVARGRGNRLRMLGALHRAGANLLLGTDTPNPFVIPGLAVHHELENFVAAGMAPADALAYATREAARFLGEAEAWGTVEVGRRADLLLLESNPLDDVRNARRLVGVMARGQWLSASRLQQMLESLRR